MTRNATPNQAERLQEKLEEIEHEEDMREITGRIDDPSRVNVRHEVMSTVAHYAEQILQKHYGSSNYGFTVTTTQQDENVILRESNPRHRHSSVELASGFELKCDYINQVGFIHDDRKHQEIVEDLSVDWLVCKSVTVANKALNKIHAIEDRRIRQQEQQGKFYGEMTQ